VRPNRFYELKVAGCNLGIKALPPAAVPSADAAGVS
jgi:hypothetical protein